MRGDVIHYIEEYGGEFDFKQYTQIYGVENIPIDIIEQYQDKIDWPSVISKGHLSKRQLHKFKKHYTPQSNSSPLPLSLFYYVNKYGTDKEVRGIFDKLPYKRKEDFFPG